MSDKLGVAIVNYACPICGQVKEEFSAIAMNKYLTNKAAEEVESLHNKTIGFSDKPCKECQSWIDKGAFFVIGIDVEKTDDMKNPYRSGHLVGIKKSSNFYQHLPKEYTRKDALFMDYKEMEKIGLIQK